MMMGDIQTLQVQIHARPSTREIVPGIWNGIALTAWGCSPGFCIDPIEKKPLNHFLPGTRTLSFGLLALGVANLTSLINFFAATAEFGGRS